MASYVDNMYQWLKRRGYSAKYEHAGIYCIKIDNTIVYIGKSTNMLRRIAEHYVAIKTNRDNRSKYYVLAEAKRKGHAINFDVLYDADAVVATGLHDLYKTKKDYSVHALRVRMQVRLVKLLPHGLVMKIWMNQQKKAKNNTGLTTK